MGYLAGDHGGLAGPGAGENQGDVLVHCDVCGLLSGKTGPEHVLRGLVDPRCSQLQELLVQLRSGGFQVVSFSGVVEPVDGFRGLGIQLLSSAVVQLLEQVCGRVGHGLGLGAADIPFGDEGGHDGFSESGDLGAEGEGFHGCLTVQELVDPVEKLCVEFLRGGSVEAIDGDILALLGEERKAVGHGEFGERYGLEFGGVSAHGLWLRTWRL